MLEHSANFEQMLDEVLVKALPYLIFSPPEFSAKLAVAMAGLWQSYEDRHSSGAFAYNVEAVMAMLDCPEATWSPGIAQRINSFQRERMSWGMRIWSLERRLDELTRKPVKAPRPVKARAAKAAPASIAVLPTVQQPTAQPTVQPAVEVVENVQQLSTHQPRRSEEIKKLTSLLEARHLSAKTILLYVTTARSILEGYDGVLPTDEQYRMDIVARGCSPKYARDKVANLRLLREALSSMGAGIVVTPALSKKVPVTTPAAPPNTAPNRVERMRRMAMHYHEGDVITLEGVRTFAQGFSESLSVPAIDGTLRMFAKSGYAVKAPGPYTYKRTGKQWGGVVG